MDDNPVQRAVDLLGGELETQIAIRVNYWTLRDWLQKRYVPATKWAVKLSEATKGAVTVKELAGLAGENGDNGDKPGRFRKGGPMTSVTYPVSGPIPCVPRLPDTAAAA
jgi:hypothetical protein